MRRTVAVVAAASLVATATSEADARPRFEPPPDRPGGAAGLRFEPRVIGSADGFVTDVAIARLDRDRRPDVAVAVDRGVETPGGAQVALNRRHGFRFGPLATGGTTPYRIATGDLDRDGDADAAVPDTVSQDLTLFTNHGTDALTATAGLPAPYLTRGIAIAELDGDRWLDVVTSANDDPDGFAPASFRLFPGAGGPQTTIPAADAFVPAETITAADVNGDRRRDLVAVDQSGIVVSHRTATGFAPVRRLALVEDLPFDLAAGDLNRDGRVDLATANLLGTRVAVLLADRSGGFAPPAYVEVGAGSAQIAIAHLDRGHRPDLAVTLLDAGKVAILRGARDGFRPPVLVDAGPAPLALEAADMDLDGDVDLVVGDRDSQELRLLVNRGRSWPAP